MEYLQRWQSSKETWKFQKSRQVWLLRHMYYLEKVPSKSFKVLVQYIGTMHEEMKNRIKSEVTEFLENKEKIPMDELEK